MKRKLIILSLCLVLIMSVMLSGCSVKLPSEVTLDKVLNEGGYKVVFEDNFNGDKVDQSKWIVGLANPIRRAGYYTNDNVFVKDGNLVIRTNYREKGELGAGWYTGWVESMDTYTSVSDNKINPNRTDDFKGFSTKYGYFEVRCKAPKTMGIWSAFWLMPDTTKDGVVGMTKDDVQNTGTDGVEIDIMESFGYKNLIKKSICQHVIHADGYGNKLKSVKSQEYNVGDMYDTFHTYGVLWTDKEYVFYIDGRETWRTKDVYNGKELGISNVNEYLLLTVEVAGVNKDGVMYPGKEYVDGKMKKHWAGNPDKNDKSKNYDFVIDYVKVMQK